MRNLTFSLFGDTLDEGAFDDMQVTVLDVPVTNSVKWSHVSFSYDGSCSPLIASKIAQSRFGTNYQQAGFPCQMLSEGFWAATHLPLYHPSSLTAEQHWVTSTVITCVLSWAIRVVTSTVRVKQLCEVCNTCC